jgi:dTMP kinase
MAARFLVLEGVDGSGKSTQATALLDWLEQKGRHPVHLREPGTTRIGENLRALLLESGRESWHPRTEALLFFAARRELLRQQVQPALEAGHDVICERFTPSTLAYQGQHEADAAFILALDHLVVGPELQPDLVLILDLDPAESLARAGVRAQSDGATLDAMEERGLEFLQAVRQGYLRYAAERAEQSFLLDVSGLSPEQVQVHLRRRLEKLL